MSNENGDYPNQPSSSSGRISPAILFIIVVVAVIFFVSGLLHLLVWFLTKHHHHRRRPDPRSGSDPEGPGQRQLRQLFHLHDSGLDQASIDALPVFLYGEITKEPFDCAVCLCEFADRDRLRLLPLCAHAFHLHCIDTWLLSNATCPLCRGALCSAETHHLFLSDDPRRNEEEEEEGIVSGDEIRKRVFSVRLGKFKAQNVVDESQRGGGTSASLVESRRCFSMGSYQYVVAESDLRVAVRPEKDAVSGGSSSMRLAKGRSEGESEMKRIGRKGESFSVSKIWQWSRKGKCPSSEEPNVVAVQGLPWTDNSQAL